MENITLIEVTEEELALIIKMREEQVKRERAEILFKQIKDISSQIEELGYTLRANDHHGEMLRCMDVHLSKK